MAVGASGDVPLTLHHPAGVMGNPGDQAGPMVQEFEAYVQDELILVVWITLEMSTLEIGARGIVNKENKETIKDISIYTTINAKNLTKELSKQAVISSYFIFLNRNERDWNNNVT